MTNRTDRIDLDGVLRLAQLSRLLGISPTTIRKKVKAGQFPIPVLTTIDVRGLRWAGPVVRTFLKNNGHLTAQEPAAPPRRVRKPKPIAAATL